MALTPGTNCGFVTAAVVSTVDPLGDNANMVTIARWARFTCPNAVTGITQFGWWADATYLSAGYDIGLYDNNAAVSCPQNRLFVLANQAIPRISTKSWVVNGALNWTVVSGLVYWFGVQCDDAGFAPWANGGTISTYVTCFISSQTSLASSYNTAAGVFAADSTLAFYGLGTYGGGGTTWNPTGKVAAAGAAAGGFSYATYRDFTGKVAASGNVVASLGVVVYKAMESAVRAAGSLFGSLFLRKYVSGKVDAGSAAAGDAYSAKGTSKIQVISEIFGGPKYAADESKNMYVRGDVEVGGGFHTVQGTGVTTTFLDQAGRTVTISKGIIISIVS